MTWKIRTFDELTAAETYAILRARCEVFIVEQECPYLDPDGLDHVSVHIIGESGGAVAAYCRITPPGTRFEETSIGRVITTAGFRGTGLGRELMRRTLAHAEAFLGADSVRISAQEYLREFYGSFGFAEVSEKPYLEDGIPHIEMVWKKNAAVSVR